MQDDLSKESGGRKGGDKDRKGQQQVHGHDVPDQLAAAQVAPAAAQGPRLPKPVSVSFSTKDSANTPDEALWEEILARSERLSFDNYASFIDSVLCEPEDGYGSALADCDDSHASGPAHGLKSYRRAAPGGTAVTPVRSRCLSPAPGGHRVLPHAQCVRGLP